MRHNVSLTIPSSSLFYFRLAKAKSDICTWLVYYSTHEARILISHDANFSETLNRVMSCLYPLMTLNSIAR